LTDYEVRLLAAIAAHDSMGQFHGKDGKPGGGGCFARTDRLAAFTNAHPSTTSSAITKLTERGYLFKDAHPFDKRRHTLHVRYDAEADHKALKNVGISAYDKIPDRPSKGISPPNGEVPRRDLAANTQRTAERVSQYTPNRPLNRDSGESASLGETKRNGNVGASLAMVERAIKAGDTVDYETVERLAEIVESGNPQTDKEAAWAARLYEVLTGEEC
jgi:DNA-binding MarR family transcriptional regulator